MASTQGCQTCAENLRVLDLVAPVSENEIRAAYRDLAKVWHPDRFQGDARLAAKAEEQFKRVQSAYEHLIAHIEMHTRDGQNAVERVNAGSSRPVAPADARADHIRKVLATFEDGERFFADPHVPPYLLQQLRYCYRDTSTVILGAVDISKTRSGRTFAAFSPDRMGFRTFGFSATVKMFEYKELTPSNVQLVETQPMPPSIFDRFVMDVGIDKRSKKNWEEGVFLHVTVGGKGVSDELDNDGCRRLHGLLLALGGVARQR